MKRITFSILALSRLALLPGPAAESTNPFTPPNCLPPKRKTASYNVRAFGATGNGLANDRPAIIRAIEKCSTEGGGDVVFPAGKYFAASLHLKRNVRLLLDTNPKEPSHYLPRQLGPRPASGFCIRHVRGLTLTNVEFALDPEDQRPPRVVFDVADFTLDGFKTQKPSGRETLRSEKIVNLTVRNTPGLADRSRSAILGKRKEPTN